MNQFDPDESDDLQALEQQLRSLRPTPPELALMVPAQKVQASLAQPGPAPVVTTSGWKPIISHSIAAAVGLAVGAAIMLMQTYKSNETEIETARVSHSSNQPENQTPAQSSGDVQLVDQKPESSEPENRFPKQRRFQRGAFELSGTQKLCALGPMGDVNVDAARLQPLESASTQDDSDGSSIEVLPQRPVLSPRRIKLLLDDLTWLPESRKPSSVEDLKS